MSVLESTPLVVGHRGGRGEGWPAENTIAAFERARREGARAIELDVRTCAGDNVVVFHDVRLARMTGGRDGRRIADVPLATLARITVGASNEEIPTLADALAWALEHGVAVNVEMKHDVPDRWALARGVARALRASRAQVLLSSFDPGVLTMAAALAPRVPRALLSHRRESRALAFLRELARPPAVRALHLERTQSSPEAIARYKHRGLRVGIWTVNDAREARDLVALGADSIITDSPGAILDALRT
jgi:glycerophosphoryl diester phosphodiesterase